MRQMKDSGIEWIGDIPATWKTNTVFQLFTQVKNKNTDLQEQNLLSLSYGKIKRRSIDTTDGLLPESFDGYNIIEADDIVLRLTDLQNDHKSLRVGLAIERGIVTSAYLTIRNRSESLSRYLYYYLHSFDIAKGFYGMGAGVRQGLNWDGMKWLKILTPSVLEQQRIVAFLDSECERIDAVIEQTRASLEEYKKLKQAVITQAVTKGVRSDRMMKDSGIEWIGEIPADCEITRFQDFGDYKKGPFGSSITKDMFVEKSANSYKVYEQKNAIYKDSQLGYYYIPEEKYRELIGFAVEAGDIIVSCAGTIGECYIMPDGCDAGVINQALMRIRVNSNTEARYFVYLFSSVLKYIADKYSNGSAMKNIPPFSILKKIKVPAFSLIEQREIADWLDKKTNAIDKLISKKESFLIEMENYKKSVIFEYVTGKKEVV